MVVTEGADGGSVGGIVATIGYSNFGVPLWTNRYFEAAPPGEGASWVSAMTVDGSGNVFVTGYSFSHGTNSQDVTHWVTIKYSSSIPPPRLDFQILNNEL